MNNSRQVVRQIFHGFHRPTLASSCSQRFCSDKKEDLYPSHVNTKDPIKRIFGILKNELKDIRRGKFDLPESEVFPAHVDVLIVGGGIIGSSIAYWIQNRVPGVFNVCVLEKDCSYGRASTPLSVGGIRQQFSLEENINLSLFAANFIKDLKKDLAVPGIDPPDVQFNPNGYLFLATEKGAEQLQKNHSLQTNLGAKIRLMSPKMLKEMFPWLNTSDIALGTYGMQNEGWLDPYMFLMALKSKAISLGVRFVDGETVGCNLKAVPNAYIEDKNGRHPYETCNSVIVRTADGHDREINFSKMVISAGHSSSKVASMLKIGTGPGILKVPLPVEPRKRFVYVFNAPDGPGLDCPLVVNPTHAYFRREGLGGNYLAGCSPSEDEEPDVANLDVDHAVFDERIWPDIAKRVPAFESLKVMSSWAGYYDYNTFDQNAIVGNHPHHGNVYFATGFSGHGLQQAPGVGRAISELIFDGEFTTIDLSRFNFERIVEDSPIFEQNIV